jgi:ferric-dicitrate binding protein FerR (iron transport regulator)
MAGWVDAQKARCEKAKAALQSRIDKMKQAMQQAQAALKMSQEEKDAEAASIAQKAIDVSKRTISRLEGMIARENSRIAAAELVGRVKGTGHGAAVSVSNGTVTRTTKGKKVELNPSTPVKPGDRISTGPNGFVEIISSDGNTIQLDRSSEYMFVKQGKDLSVYKLRTGRIRQVVTQVKRLSARGKKFMLRRTEVRTPKGAVAVRGTSFELEAGNEATKVTVFDGEVELAAKRGKLKVKVKKGETVSIDSKGKINGPGPFEAKSIKKWWEVTK